jgi:hypothetical protein
MATNGSKRPPRPQKKAAGRASSDGDRPARRKPRAPVRTVVAKAVGELVDLIGRPPEGVVGVENLDGETWRIQVEVVESHRIPDTTDILAVYEVDADGDGSLIAYRRLNRYVRGRFEE